MLDPERKQKGESQEEYAIRISKFPILHPNTILHVVFPYSSQLTLQIIVDWARPVFPESFPPTDWDGRPFINPKNISTKAFAKWVAEEKIFGAWIAAGQKVYSTGKLFVDLVNGKGINSKQAQASKKVSRKKPHPSTDRGRLDFFKNETFIPLVEQVLNKNPDWQNSQILSHKDVDDAIDKCGFPKGKPSKSTIKKWIRTARKNAGAKAKTGRPTK